MHSTHRLLLVLALAGCARESPIPEQRAATTGAPATPTPTPQFRVSGPLSSLAAWRDSQTVILRADSGSPRADTLFLLIKRALWARVRAASDSVAEDSSFQQAAVFGAGEDSLTRALAAAGVDVVQSEGNAYLELNTDSLAAHLTRFLTQPLQEFLRLRAQDEVEGFSEDAGLTISWARLAQRVATWDRFSGAYPHLATDEAQFWYSTYLRTYLTGMDNSRTFTFPDSALEPEVRRSYEQFARTYRHTRAGQLVVGYLAALAADGYREGPAGAAFLERAGVKTMLGVQPPVR